MDDESRRRRRRACGACGERCTRQCGACMSRPYCGSECQQAELAVHKLTCGVDCAVCMERCTWNKREPQKNVFWLSCKHGFHRDCITTWVASGHLSCPLCRAIPDNIVIIFSFEPEVFPHGTLIMACGATAWLAFSHEVEGWEAELSKASDGTRSLYSCAPTRQLEDDLQGSAYTASVQAPRLTDEAEAPYDEAEAPYDEAAAEAWLDEQEAYQAFMEERLQEIQQERQEMQDYHSQAETDDDGLYVWDEATDATTEATTEATTDATREATTETTTEAT